MRAVISPATPTGRGLVACVTYGGAAAGHEGRVWVQKAEWPGFKSRLYP